MLKLESEDLIEAVEELRLSTEGDEYSCGFSLGATCETCGHNEASIKEIREKATPETILTLSEELTDTADEIADLNEQLEEALRTMKRLAHQRDEILAVLLDDETDDES